MPHIEVSNDLHSRLKKLSTPLFTEADVIERLLDAFETISPPVARVSSLPAKTLGAPADIPLRSREHLRGERSAGELATEVYVNYGHGDEWRQWEDARKFNFICAGGARRFSGPLFGLCPSERLWVYAPGYGYVGVAHVTGAPQRAADFLIGPEENQRPLAEVLGPEYANDSNYADDPDRCEYFIPVQWLRTVALEEAVWEPDFFANAAIVCRPTSQRWVSTVERLKEEFGV